MVFCQNLRPLRRSFRQRIRNHDGKKELRVYDYVDSLVPMLARMYKKRLSGYQAIGYMVAGGAGAQVV